MSTNQQGSQIIKNIKANKEKHKTLLYKLSADNMK